VVAIATATADLADSASDISSTCITSDTKIAALSASTAKVKPIFDPNVPLIRDRTTYPALK